MAYHYTQYTRICTHNGKHERACTHTHTCSCHLPLGLEDPEKANTHASKFITLREACIQEEGLCTSDTDDVLYLAVISRRSGIPPGSLKQTLPALLTAGVQQEFDCICTKRASLQTPAAIRNHNGGVWWQHCTRPYHHCIRCK